jgi:SAM-dependent methyltransferase
MEENQTVWHQYYERALARPHSNTTAIALNANQSSRLVAIDCGCGAGSDIQYLLDHGYQVHGFDLNPDAIAMCKQRFVDQPNVTLTESSFEAFDYPNADVIVAHSSLYFADPDCFATTWRRLTRSLDVGGVFAGDFMGQNDDWASNHHTTTMPLTTSAVKALFQGFDVISFDEREQNAKTSLGKMKHWHTYRVVAMKRE